MKRRTLFNLTLAVACVPVSVFAAASERQLRVVTAHLPPLVIENGGDRPGALYELLMELCKRMKLDAKPEFVPWKRAQFLATTMPSTAIFPLTRLPDRETRFRWLAPMYEEHYLFLAKRGAKFDIQHPESMKDSRVVTLRGAGQALMLRELGYHNLVEASSIEEVHRFLLQGMADAVFGERFIIQSSLKSRNAEKEFNLSPPVRSTTAWLAGSLDFDDGTIQRFQRTKAVMDADGTSQRILAKYGLA
jgi:ABC-type amino acid transport substrate-binding protein